MGAARQYIKYENDVSPFFKNAKRPGGEVVFRQSIISHKSVPVNLIAQLMAKGVDAKIVKSLERSNIETIKFVASLV